MDHSEIVLIVEGKNDQAKLRSLLHHKVEIFCTFGTPGTNKIEELKERIGERDVFIFTDNDSAGRKIRALLCEEFPDAQQLYTKKGYAGVEGTPQEWIIEQLEKKGLEAYIVYPDPPFVPNSSRPQYQGKKLGD